MIKTLRLSLLSLFAVLCGTMFADTYTHEFVKDEITASGTVTLSDVGWDISACNYFGWDSQNGKGFQFGSGSNPCATLKVSTNGIEGTITEVKVTTSGAKDIAGTLDVTVGGAAFGEQYTLTKTSTEVTFTGSASGEIALNYAQTSSKAIYIKSIAVTYTTQSQPTVNYYVVGSMTDWGVNDAYKMTLNEKAEVEEYVYTMALTTESQFKVVKQDGSNQTWYPDGMGNNYGGNGEITADGNYKISFRPNGQDGWFYNYIKVEAYAESTLMAEAKELASDADAVAVGKLLAAIATAEATGDETELQAAVNQFKADNADQEKDETARVATNGWKNFNGGNAGVCATQFAPAITTYDGRNAQLAEVYEEGTTEGTAVNRIGTIIYQDITGLTNGKYKVGFYGNAFFTPGRAGMTSDMADGANDVAYVFANDQKEFITANIATSTTENNFRQFDVEVTDGTIKLGMGKDKPGTNWHTMQIYQLTWFTTAKEVYASLKANMTTEIEAAKALKTEERTQGLEAFDAAIAAAEATLTSNMLNTQELEAAIATLKAAEHAFEFAQYTADNPSADLLINGSCDAANLGWTLTNMKYQANNERPTRYIEQWTNGANDGHLADGSAKQTLKGMPAGAYVLKATANAQQQSHSDWTINGAKLFVNTAEAEVSGAWKDYQIVYNHQAEGDIEVGFKMESTNANWVGIDQLSLVYYGDYAAYVIAAPKKDYQAALAEARAALEAEKNVSGTEKRNLEAEIAKAEPTSAEGYTAATAALKAATKTFTDAAPDYNNLAAANALVVDLLYAKADKKPATKTAETAADAKTAAEELYAALRAYYESNAKAEGVEDAVDLTETIVNPAGNDGTNGWTTTNGEGSTGSIDIKSNEPWVSADGTAAHNYFDGGDWNKAAWDVSFTQDVTLEPGKYLLSAISRASADVELKLFAGTDSVKTASIGAAGGVFNRGWNIHNVEFEVAKAGAVTIGIRGVTSAIHNWMSFSDFRLVQLDDNAIKGFISMATTVPTNPDTPVQGITRAEQKVTITEGETENSVNVTFSGFNLQIPPTVKFENLTLAATATPEMDGSISYSSEEQNITVQNGQMIMNYKATVEGTQASADATPELVLILKQGAATIITFAETEEVADSLLEVTLAKRGLVTVPETATIERNWILDGAFQDVDSQYLIQDSTMVAFDGNDIYVKGLAYYFEDAWIKGTISDGKAIFKNCQTVGVDEYGVEYLAGGTDGEENIIPAENIIFSYDAENHKLTLETDYILETGDKTGTDMNMLWGIWYDVDIYQGELTKPQVVEVPANLETEDYTLECQKYVEPETQGEKGKMEDYAAAIKIGFNGNDVYVQGLCEDLPEAWIKGTIANGKATFATGQYFGAIELTFYEKNYSFPIYFLGIDPVTGISDLVMDYDAQTGDFTSSAIIILNDYEKKVISEIDAYYLPSFKKGNIDGIQEVKTENENMVIFNLNGQKLNKVQKGLNIVNGKKILRK
ncbi:MAG: hypothetical protein K6D91_07340 [Prevotella sp.]|nr:hypothetical protein [Prevotella sp.]